MFNKMQLLKPLLNITKFFLSVCVTVLTNKVFKQKVLANLVLMSFQYKTISEVWPGKDAANCQTADLTVSTTLSRI